MATYKRGMLTAEQTDSRVHPLQGVSRNPNKERADTVASVLYLSLYQETIREVLNSPIILFKCLPLTFLSLNRFDDFTTLFTR